MLLPLRTKVSSSPILYPAHHVVSVVDWFDARIYCEGLLTGSRPQPRHCSLPDSLSYHYVSILRLFLHLLLVHSLNHHSLSTLFSAPNIHTVFTRFPITLPLYRPYSLPTAPTSSTSVVFFFISFFFISD